MRTNRSIRLGIALIAGAFVLLLVYLIFGRRGSETTVANNSVPPEGLTPVSLSTGKRSAVALENIPERSIITPGMFEMEDIPEDAPSGDYVIDPEAQGIGFITRRPIRAGDRIRKSYLLGHITDVGIAGALRPGTRAMIVPLANKPTFHDLVRIGDSVDIIAAFDQAESRTLVEGVRVLAVDVFGKDYPQTSVAMRGDYKAPARSIRTANPPSPGGNNAPGATPAPAATPTAGQPVAGQPAPTPTPTPDATPPPPRPAPALTVEVTPDQANRISLAQNSGGALDFIIVPREEPRPSGPSVETRVVAVIRPQIAPYAEGRKRAPTANERAARTLATSFNRGSDKLAGAIRDSNSSYSSPNLPNPAPVGGSTPPATFGPQEPSTYAIPVYVDGKRVRVDVVRKPED